MERPLGDLDFSTPLGSSWQTSRSKTAWSPKEGIPSVGCRLVFGLQHHVWKWGIPVSLFLGKSLNHLWPQSSGGGKWSEWQVSCDLQVRLGNWLCPAPPCPHCTWSYWIRLKKRGLGPLLLAVSAAGVGFCIAGVSCTLSQVFYP